MPFTHALSPTLFSVGPFALRYYSLAYLLGFVLAYFWLRWCVKKKLIALEKKDIDDLVLWIALGTVIGGRLGYMLFYNASALFSFETFMVWQGGMSFHGGLLGIVLAAVVFARRKKMSVLAITDMLAIPGAIALFFGRIANFINAELVGMPTSVSWCVVFPNTDDLCRHPSQLYEAAKNAISAVVLSIVLLKTNVKTGTLTGLFLILYGILRTTVTIFRDDVRWVVLGPISLGTGQVLSVVTALVGIVLLLYIYKKK